MVGWRGVDRPAETFFHQARNPATVIEMRMGKNDGIDFARRDRSILPIALAPFLLSLEKSAVDQNLKSLLATRIVGSVDQVLRARDRAGGAEKLNVGQTSSSKIAEVRSQTAEVNLRGSILPLQSDL